MRDKLSFEMVPSKKNSKLCKLLDDAGIESYFMFLREDSYNLSYMAVYPPYGGGAKYKGFHDFKRYVKRIIKNKKKNEKGK